MKERLKDIILILLAIAMLLGAFWVGKDTMATTEKVLIGFSYTIFFFVLIEHIPNRIKQQRYGALIRQELVLALNLISNVREALNISPKNVQKKTEGYIKNRPQSIRAKSIQEAPLSSEIESIQTIEYPSIGMFLELTQKKIKQVKRRLEKFTFFVESELLEIIIDIEKFHLSRSSELLKDNKIHASVEAVLPEFKHILVLESKIKAYLEKH